MIFKQLIINNFRQFYGQQTIKFATDKKNNVTVIHGFNGSGKTTLLNAFTWLFYGEFSPDFENQEHLETEAAFAKIEAGKELVTSAKLIFEDKGREYTAERRIVIGKNNTGKRFIQKPTQLTLKYFDETGEVKEPGNPQDSLEQLLPKPLYPFFFFNGERIEKLASSEAYEQIESGVKVLLDIEVFDRAIAHLDGKVARDLREEIAKHAGEEGKKARQEREQIEEKKTKVEEELAQLRRNFKGLQEEKEKIDSKLAQRRWEAISNVKSTIEKIRTLRHQQLSKDLSQRLGDVWSRIAIKDYQAKLDEQYHLRLSKNVGGVEEPVRGASTGEKQVLSLAFIGSLVDKARSTYDEQTDKKILFKGGLYPLVIDSAFGQLEPEYKRDVAKWIPTLAPQVIVLVSESQWKKEVEEELETRIGYEWILQCSTPKKRTKNITLGGRDYQYVVESHDGFEKTTIVEVEL